MEGSYLLFSIFRMNCIYKSNCFQDVNMIANVFVTGAIIPSRKPRKILSRTSNNNTA